MTVVQLHLLLTVAHVLRDTIRDRERPNAIPPDRWHAEALAALNAALAPFPPEQYRQESRR